MAPLVDQVQVDLTQSGREAVGVVTLVLDPVAPRGEDAVVHRAVGVRTHRAEDALGLVPERELLAILETHAHRSRHRPEHADPQPSLLEVLAQQVVRLLVATLDERGDGAGHLVVRGGSHGVPPVGAS